MARRYEIVLVLLLALSVCVTCSIKSEMFRKIRKLVGRSLKTKKLKSTESYAERKHVESSESCTKAQLLGLLGRKSYADAFTVYGQTYGSVKENTMVVSREVLALELKPSWKFVGKKLPVRYRDQSKRPYISKFRDNYANMYNLYCNELWWIIGDIGIHPWKGDLSLTLIDESMIVDGYARNYQVPADVKNVIASYLPIESDQCSKSVLLKLVALDLDLGSNVLTLHEFERASNFGEITYLRSGESGCVCLSRSHKFLANNYIEFDDGMRCREVTCMGSAWKVGSLVIDKPGQLSVVADLRITSLVWSLVWDRNGCLTRSLLTNRVRFPSFQMKRSLWMDLNKILLRMIFKI
eukprot:182868_1